MSKWKKARDMPMGTKCSYCESPAREWDHIVPFCLIGESGGKKNLTPACRECNGIAGGKVFDSFEEKRLYILDRKAHIRGLYEVYCSNGCGVTYAERGQTNYCPDCGEALDIQKHARE